MRTLEKCLTLTLSVALCVVPSLRAAADPTLYPDGSARFSASGSQIPLVDVNVADVCDIMLQPGEKIRQAIVSDSERWKITDGLSGESTPHIFVKPTESGIRALLTITTTRRVYHVRLRSTDAGGREFVGFYYPVQLERIQALGPRHIARSTVPATSPAYACSTPLDSKYQFSGSGQFRPKSVCNDGAHTYVNMDHIDGNLPVVVIVGDDGHDQIGNFSFDNTHQEYTLDGVPKKLALLRNGGRGQVRVDIERRGK